METYSLLREIADSWVLLAMFTFFVGVVIWAFLPSHADDRKEASLIPFRHEDSPEESAEYMRDDVDLRAEEKAHG